MFEPMTFMRGDKPIFLFKRQIVSKQLYENVIYAEENLFFMKNCGIHNINKRNKNELAVRDSLHKITNSFKGQCITLYK